MDIRGNGGNGLILIDVDEMLKNFGFCCCIRCANCFWTDLYTLVVALLSKKYYYPGPGVTSYYFISLNRATPDLNTGLGRDISRILMSSV